MMSGCSLGAGWIDQARPRTWTFITADIRCGNAHGAELLQGGLWEVESRSGDEGDPNAGDSSGRSAVVSGSSGHGGESPCNADDIIKRQITDDADIGAANDRSPPRCCGSASCLWRIEARHP